MDDIIAKLIKNYSDDNCFLFAVACSECGNIWYSHPVPFSKAGQSADTRAKVTLYRALYRQEMEKAAAQAVQQAKEHFNLCPVCHSLVCDNCFLICDETDMCSRCAKELGESGEQVGTGKKR